SPGVGAGTPLLLGLLAVVDKAAGSHRRLLAGGGGGMGRWGAPPPGPPPSAPRGRGAGGGVRGRAPAVGGAGRGPPGSFGAAGAASGRLSAEECFRLWLLAVRQARKTPIAPDVQRSASGSGSWQ